MTASRLDLPMRPRRLRRTQSLRRMVRETVLTPANLVQPLFIMDGEGLREPIPSLPGQARLSIDVLIEEAKAIDALGIPAIALFPKTKDNEKDARGTLAGSDDGLVPRAVRALKAAVPGLMVICDVALDPYTTTGQDGIVEDGVILNDATVDALVHQALAQARAGADVVAPSDMMDGRIGAIRDALDANGFEDVAILAYSAKYASALYGPFRDALDSAPRGGADKKTYQMDPANRREAMREVELDVQEGADIVMVKPALPYLDIVADVSAGFETPVAAYHVSGEFAQLKAAAQNGWLDYDAVLLETLTAIKRAGANMIFTYGACDAAKLL